MTPQPTPPKEAPEEKGPSCRAIGKHIVKAITAIVALGLVFYLIWNWTAVPLFTFPSLTYLQALGAIFLMGFLLLVARHTVGRCRNRHDDDPSLGGCRFSGCRPDPSQDA